MGIVLALEVSRLARNNADWYRLLDLAGMTDTLIADADGIYHPGLFNDRMLLGMKGTMSEAELHILRARLDGGIRSKAARGELRRGLPVGLVWGDADGEIRWHPDEAVTGVIAAIFERFTVCGSVRGVWLWLREHELKFPLQPTAYLRGGEITWVEPTYHAVHNVLTHPAYAGAYVFGRTRQRRQRRRRRGAAGAPPQAAARRMGGAHHRPPPRVHRLGHLPGQPDLVSAPTPARRRTSPAPARSVRAARCCRGWPPAGCAGANSPSTTTARPRPRPATTAPAPARWSRAKAPATCASAEQAIDTAVAEAFLAALQPAALQACLAAAQHLEDGHDAALAQWRRQVEQARYQAGRAERRYRAVDPDNRLVARGLETEWNTALQALADAEAELARRETARPKTLTPQEKSAILALGDDLAAAWSAPTTTDKDRKQLLRSLLDEVNINVHRDHTDAHAELLLRWKGGAITDLSVPIKRKPPNRLRTDEDTIDLVRRLAAHYPDAMIAHILNRQDRRTARGLSFTAGRVQSLRHHCKIPCHQPEPTTRPKENCSPWPTPPNQLGLGALHAAPLARPTGSSPASNSPPARPGGSGSPTTSAPCSSTTPPTAGSPCWRPPSPTACRAKPSCNVSSAANCKPSTSAPDAEKACVSSPQPARKDCFDHDNQRKEQCDNASKNFWISKSITQSLFQHRCRHAATASRADRYGR